MTIRLPAALPLVNFRLFQCPGGDLLGAALDVRWSPPRPDRPLTPGSPRSPRPRAGSLLHAPSPCPHRCDASLHPHPVNSRLSRDPPPSRVCSAGEARSKRDGRKCFARSPGGFAPDWQRSADDDLDALELLELQCLVVAIARRSAPTRFIVPSGTGRPEQDLLHRPGDTDLDPLAAGQVRATPRRPSGTRRLARPTPGPAANRPSPRPRRRRSPWSGRRADRAVRDHVHVPPAGLTSM